jgi:hypothetical protein
MQLLSNFNSTEILLQVLKDSTFELYKQQKYYHISV